MNQIAVIFVYQHQSTGEIRARWLDDAEILDKDDDWTHIGSVEPRSYINSLLAEFPALVRELKGEAHREAQ